MSAHDVRTVELLQQRQCPECGGTEVIADRVVGEVMCRTCGLVLVEETLDRAPEWRAFTPIEKQTKTRTGSPSTLQHFDKGLSTTFHPRHDQFGKPLPPKIQTLMWRLRRWQSRARVHSSQDRNLVQAMSELSRLTDKLNIPPDVTENAAIIYRKALQRNLVRGRSIHGVTAASLYLACRQTQLPRKLDTFADTSSRTHKEVSRCIRLLHNALNLTLPIDDPEKYLAKITTTLGLPQRVQNTARQLIHTARARHATAGKSPVGIAASAIYIAARVADTPVTQKEIAVAADVTEATVRNRYRDLVRVLNLTL